jgi:hypothetical protein
MPYTSKAYRRFRESDVWKRLSAAPRGASDMRTLQYRDGDTLPSQGLVP